MAVWVELRGLPVARREEQGRHRPPLVPLVVVPGLLVVLDRVALAVVAAVALVAVSQAVALSPRAAQVSSRVLTAVEHVVGTGLRVVLLGLAYLVGFVPARLLGAFTRRNGPRPPGAPASEGWGDRSRLVGAPTPKRPYERRPPVAGGPVANTLRVAGVVGLLLVVDVVLGSALIGTDVLTAPSAREIERQQALADAFAASPAMQEHDWAEAYFDDYVDRVWRGTPEFLPYTIYGQEDWDSEFVEVHDGVRTSYEPDLDDAEPFRIAFFGGSTMFGDGQRDEHTIPSEVARLAEGAGVPVEVTNYGVPAWVAWQELHRFEDAATDEGGFDLAVFYDGVNDLGVQYDSYSEDPTHLGVDALQEMSEDYRDEKISYPTTWEGLDDVVGAYLDTSAVANLVRELTAPDDPLDLENPSQEFAVEATDEERAAAASQLYARASTLIEDVGREHDTPVLRTWQPRLDPYPPGMVASLPEGTVDLSEALAGHEDVFYDPAHTNERGARLVAEALWEQIQPRLEAAGSPGGGQG